MFPLHTEDLKQKATEKHISGGVKPTNISDYAPRRQVQQELLHFGPGFIAAVVEIWSDLVVDAVHVVSLQLTGSLLHHVHPGCLMQPHSIVAAGGGGERGKGDRQSISPPTHYSVFFWVEKHKI